MSQDDMLQRIFEKLVSLEKGQEGLKTEILANRQAILELQGEVQEIKHGMRFYDYKLVEHEKQIFRLKS
ncbi:hypothetical protein [Ammoniphilus sp. 3BR4]|uniref:hypothetical protein n=1 Tax=Ammoniphilus sp. 3BR4 TaxID=3158265 RepID=UPI00346677AD